MHPLESLHEEYNNVDRALQETLRYDYGPEQSAEFYDECAGRLGRIKRRIESCNPTDRQSVAALLSDLGYVATLISLIERSHLGELSWPFADELRRLAKALLTEPGLLGDPSYPIVHVVADGRGYRILHEDAAKSANSGRRLAK